jgi:hypothetical protein
VNSRITSGIGVRAIVKNTDTIATSRNARFHGWRKASFV